MLRQALDEAENQQRLQQQQQQQEQQQPQEQEQTNERSALLPPVAVVRTQRQDINYEATNSGNGYIDDHGYDEGSDYEEDDDDDEYSLEEESIASQVDSYLIRAWKAAKGCFMIVVNVENLWDSPTTRQGEEISRRNKGVVLFWFFILALSYSGERTTFKLLVDRSGPFRLLSVGIVTLTHSIMVGCGMLISAISRKDFSMQPLGIPPVDVALMALLDTVHMLLVFLTCYHVAPTLTVILSQFTLPLTALLSQFVHKDGYFKRCCGQQTNEESSNEDDQSPGTMYDTNVGTPIPGFGGLSMEHISGSIIISLAVLLALSPSLYSLLDQNFFIYADPLPEMTAYNTILFVSACIPAAASQLYKEHIFLEYKQPVPPDYLNFILSIFQLIFASIMSPLVYSLLGFAAADDWPKLYPSSEFSKNFVEGFQCFIGTLDEEEAVNGFHDDAKCEHALLLVVLYSFSVISIGVAVDKIVHAGGKTTIVASKPCAPDNHGFSNVNQPSLLVLVSNKGHVSRGQRRDYFVCYQSVHLRQAYSVFQLRTCN